MKAVYFESCGGIEDLKVGDLDLPPPELKEGELRLQFLAGSLNHLDLWVLGGLPHLKYQFPHVVGADLCGRVIETRSNQFVVGEEVLAYPAESQGVDDRGHPKPENLCRDFRIRGESMPGVFCENLVVSERFVRKRPEHLSVSEAAALPLVYLTAWQMLTEKAGLFPGNFDASAVGPILVHSAGSGVSQALLELLLSMNLSDLFVTSREAKKLEPYRARGVRGIELSPDWELELRQSKQNFQIIFDHVGESLFESNVKLLRSGGVFVTCGASSGWGASLDLRHLFFRQLELKGSTMGSLRHFHEVLDWIEFSKIRPHPPELYPFADVRAAYERLSSGKQFGKLVIGG